MFCYAFWFGLFCVVVLCFVCSVVLCFVLFCPQAVFAVFWCLFVVVLCCVAVGCVALRWVELRCGVLRCGGLPCAALRLPATGLLLGLQIFRRRSQVGGSRVLTYSPSQPARPKKETSRRVWLGCEAGRGALAAVLGRPGSPLLL